MAYDVWTEGYLKAKQSKANKFDPNISIRFERVGNWIVLILKIVTMSLLQWKK